MDGVFIRGEAQTQREGHVTTGVTRPRVQGHLEPPAAGSGREGPPREPLEGARPCPHLDFRLLSRTGRENTSVFKPRSSGHFVVAGPRKPPDASILVPLFSVTEKHVYYDNVSSK